MARAGQGWAGQSRAGGRAGAIFGDNSELQKKQLLTGPKQTNGKQKFNKH